MVDAPRLFDATFRAASLILPAETAAKVKFVRRARGSGGAATRAYLAARQDFAEHFSRTLELRVGAQTISSLRSDLSAFVAGGS